MQYTQIYFIVRKMFFTLFIPTRTYIQQDLCLVFKATAFTILLLINIMKLSGHVNIGWYIIEYRSLHKYRYV
jgi:hypothetical protein